MELCRITKAPRADLSGTGGLYASGRWHNRGRLIVYTAMRLGCLPSHREQERTHS